MKFKKVFIFIFFNILWSCDKFIKEDKIYSTIEEIDNGRKKGKELLLKKENFKKKEIAIEQKTNQAKKENLKIEIDFKTYFKKNHLDKQLSQDLTLVNNNSNLSIEELLKFAFWESSKSGFESWYDIRNGNHIEISVGAIE